MSLIIREFNDRDLPQVQRCFIELQEHERQTDPERVPGDQICERYCANLLDEVNQHKGKVFIAELGDVVVGFVAVWVEEYLEIDKEELYVSDLVVRSQYRGAGVGKQLMERAEQYARELDLSRISLSVLKGNALAYDFYRHCGYSDDAIAMVKKW